MDADRAESSPATPTWNKWSAEAKPAKEAGIDGVPTFIFGGRLAVSGAQAPDYLAAMIERAAAGERAPAWSSKSSPPPRHRVD